MGIFFLFLVILVIYLGYKYLKEPTHFTTAGGHVEFKAIKNYGFFEHKNRLIVYLLLYNEKFVVFDNSLSSEISREKIQKWVGYEKELPVYKILEMDKRIEEQPILKEFIKKLKKLEPITDEFLVSLRKEGNSMLNKYQD